MIKLKHLLPECNECARDWNHGHDHEAGMAKNELRDMISNASKIDSMVGEGDNLPGWVSAYISLAADYMHSVSEYLAGETSRMQEPGPGYGIEEDMKQGQSLAGMESKLGTLYNVPEELKGKELVILDGPDKGKKGTFLFYDTRDKLVGVQLPGGKSTRLYPKELQFTSPITEKKAHSKAQQAAIAIAMQKAGKKPK